VIVVVNIAAPPVVRHGLDRMCETMRDITVVADAADLCTGIRLVDELRPDVVVVDLPCAARRPDKAAALRELTARTVAVVALLSPILPQAHVDDLFALGVLGAVNNDTDAAGLGQAITAVSRGGRLCAAGPRHARQRLRAVADRGENLTDKEIDVLALVAAGLSNQEIGETLLISENTAKFHVGNVIRKFGAKRRGELAHLAAADGIFGRRSTPDQQKRRVDSEKV